MPVQPNDDISTINNTVSNPGKQNLTQRQLVATNKLPQPTQTSSQVLLDNIVWL
jgi:hypothetical protein